MTTSLQRDLRHDRAMSPIRFAAGATVRVGTDPWAVVDIDQPLP